jgi:hypothetical protein
MGWIAPGINAFCGMKRWVGFGVIADNLIHIADYMAANDKA